MTRRWIWILAATLAAAAALGARDGGLDGHARFTKPDGSIVFAGAASLEGLVHLDSWFVPEGAAAGFHHVYTQPEAIAGYRETGRFPDGAVLVKEIRAHTRGNYSTGTDVASSTKPVQWFVMVKDARGRHPDHPLWQEGWGWALFTADAPAAQAAKSFVADCQGCHLPARGTDWVYVGGYPRLAGE
jgi:hypothetical protein